MFSNKFARNEKINLTEENEIISTDSELNRVFNNLFSKAVEELKIPSVSNFTHNESNDSFTEALSYFENPLSIVNMKRRVLIEKEFLEKLIPRKFLNLSKF